MTQPAFAKPEYDARVLKARKAMKDRGLDALIVTDPSNMAWLTGYDGWSFYVHQAVVLGPDDGIFWWGRGMDAPGATRTTYLTEEQIRPYEDSFVQNPEKHTMLDLIDKLNALGWGELRTGVEMENYYFTAQSYLALKDSGRFSALVDATGLVNWERIVKSDAEITYVRRAGRIVEEMHRIIRDNAREGMPKNELIADIMTQALRGADGHWGDYPAIMPMAPSGIDATAAHLTWDDTPLKAGEPTFFELAGCYRRYHCPQSRTIFIGTPEKKYLDAQEAVAAATKTVLETMKPGITCGDVAEAFTDTLNTFGFQKEGRCGYSIGLSYPPDWGERTLSLRKGDKTVLRSGMVIHFMPALWLDDGGLETTETVLVTKDGCETICDTPSELFVV